MNSTLISDDREELDFPHAIHRSLSIEARLVKTHVWVDCKHYNKSNIIFINISSMKVVMSNIVY